MSDWKRYRIFELAHLNKNSIDRSYPFTHIEYLDTSSIVCGSISGYQAIPLKEAPSRAKRIVKQNSIVYSTVRPIQRHYGLLKSPKPHTVVSTGFTVLDANTTLVDPYFLYYWLTRDEIVEYLEKLASSSTSTYPSIRPDDIGDLIVDLPPINEQKAIAEILSSLDDKIELNNQTNANLEALAQAIFKQWFIHFEFPDDNGNPYKSSGGKMVDSELGEIPEKWNVATLKEHVVADRGLSYKGKGLTDAANGIPMINLNSVFEGGGYKYEGLKYYSGDYKEKHVIKPGEIAVTNTEQGHKYLLIGYPALIPNSVGDIAIFSHHIYKVVAQENSHLSNFFIYYLLHQPAIREQVISACNGTTVNMLKIHGLEIPRFVCPPKALVDEFTRFIKDVLCKKEFLSQESKNLTSLRDVLLPKLISGQISIE